MHFHWQNLNDKPGGRQGSGLRHGRAWWHLGPQDRERTTIGLCWVLLGLRCGLRFDVHQADGVGLHLAVSVPVLGSLYLTLDGPPFSWLARWLLRLSKAGYNDREVNVYVHDWSLWWSFWNNSMEWSRKTPRWRHGCFHALDLLLGKWKYAERDLAVAQAVVPMPEGAYPATVTLKEATWKRPRWFTRRLLRAEVDVNANPIPCPGKGENSWDCGEDATYSLSCVANTVEAAIAAMVETSLRKRRRHGGSVMWQPEPKREERAQ